jgi:undecaprenyl pyrophosphate phosphatase UppP
MSYYGKKKDNTALNMVVMMIAGFSASGFAAWAVVEFILYLVKDNPFNWTSLWLLGTAIVVEIIFFVKNIMSD